MSVPVLARGRSLHVVGRRRVSTLLSTRLFSPPVNAAANSGLAVPGIAILETKGRVELAAQRADAALELGTVPSF